MLFSRSPLVALAVAVAGLTLLLACGRASGAQDAPSVRGHLAGTVTVSAGIDSSMDYRGFEVMVVQASDTRIDTLGRAVTGRDGRFAMPVTAPERGLYPLVVRRDGQTLVSTELVVADADSATMAVELPLRRMVRIRSRENAAWLAYRNTVALHRRALTDDLQRLVTDIGAAERSVRQTSAILWDLRSSYDGTFAAALAAAESIALLEGVDDSLAVARAQAIAPDNPRFVTVALAARRAQARLAGHAAAVALVRQFQEQATTDASRAALQAAIVRAHIDSLRAEDALDAANVLARRYDDTPWADWAERARYEVEHLMPGMEAPAFEAATVTGDTLRLADLRGRPVLLEFYRPGDDAYQRQLPMRRAFYNATRDDDLALVSVSMEPDALLNEAFREGRDLPGRHVVAADGMQGDLARRYNLATLPTRVLLDAQGHLVGTYVGDTYLPVQRDYAALTQPPATTGAERTGPATEGE